MACWLAQARTSWVCLAGQAAAPLTRRRPGPSVAAERGKESTLGVEMVAQSARGEAGGASLYDFEYELDSTRGRKRIMSTGEGGGEEG